MNKKNVNIILILTTIIICLLGLYVFLEEGLFSKDRSNGIAGFLYVLKIIIPLITISHIGICTGLWYLINHK